MAETKSDRRQALELAISQIERQFGKGSVMRLGAGGPLEEIAVRRWIWPSLRSSGSSAKGP